MVEEVIAVVTIVISEHIQFLYNEVLGFCYRLVESVGFFKKAFRGGDTASLPSSVIRMCNNLNPPPLTFLI